MYYFLQQHLSITNARTTTIIEKAPKATENIMRFVMVNWILSLAEVVTGIESESHMLVATFFIG